LTNTVKQGIWGANEAQHVARGKTLIHTHARTHARTHTHTHTHTRDGQAYTGGGAWAVQHSHADKMNRGTQKQKVHTHTNVARTQM